MTAPKKRKKIILKPRQEFELANQGWINFLNCDIEKIEFKGMTEYFDGLQNENCLFISDIGENHKGVLPKYEDEKDFIKEAHRFMYENLKKISKGQSKKLQEFGKFGLKEVRALINLIKILYVDEYANIFKDKYADSEDTIIYTLARIIDGFLSYIGSFLKKENKFFVSVCPYHRKKNQECGIIFVARGKNTEACEQHRKAWGYMKYNRKIQNAKV